MSGNVMVRLEWIPNLLRALLQPVRRLATLAWRRTRRVLGSPILGHLIAILLLGCLLAGTVTAGIWTALARVAPGSIGVRQDDWGLSSRMEDSDLEPGLHWAVRGWSSIRQLTSGPRIASFGFASEGAHRPPLEIRTLDGNAPKIHANVIFHMAKGEGHRVLAAGLKSAWEERVESRIEKALFEELSRTTSDSLMQAEQIGEVSRSVLRALEEDLRPLYAEVDQVLINGVTFPASYEGKLRERQLESQAILTDASLAKRARMKTENALVAHRLDTERAEVGWALDREIDALRLELESRIAEETRRGIDEVHSMGLQAEKAYQELAADGDLALARAEARHQERLGQALAGPGGRLLMALETAESLEISRLEVGPRSEAPWLDLDAWLELLAGPE